MAPPKSSTCGGMTRVEYEATLHGDIVVMFVKGLNLRSHKISDPTRIRCHFGLKVSTKAMPFYLPRELFLWLKKL
ncbi:hypothetical protein GYH30_002754 [Glycine max]|nr:hypothetical protein GYH30_002754 [Glycine max]